MTIEGDNSDENTSVGLVVKMTSPSGKHERFKETAMGSNIWQYELKEKGIYTIEVTYLILENGKSEKWFAQTEYFISGDETSVSASLSYGSSNYVPCQSSTPDKDRPCKLTIRKKYPSKFQGNFDEKDEEAEKSTESYPEYYWAINVESIYTDAVE